VNRLGRKTAAVATVTSTALFTASYMMSKALWPSLALVCTSCVLAGFMHSSVDSFNLEQVSQFHGPMMSLSKATSTLGGVIGSGLGGLTLILHGYSGVGAILGSFGIFSGIVYYTFAREPIPRTID